MEKDKATEAVNACLQAALAVQDIDPSDPRVKAEAATLQDQLRMLEQPIKQPTANT